ncbi:hypothetical protein HTVC048P_gp28 [Pelagibacter phage HTVC048P]|nr:hypothetical protein HTVC048P_gp28 [Pelagibacter phage HTVC048P]
MDKLSLLLIALLSSYMGYVFVLAVINTVCDCI